MSQITFGQWYETTLSSKEDQVKTFACELFQKLPDCEHKAVPIAWENDLNDAINHCRVVNAMKPSDYEDLINATLSLL
jgi:hypothetical protein